ncbi:MAG: hypothetical protein M1300_07405 [Epsilonproteobacteria bacterium]|nr:hypothetical protein [Campylobacterota bacterium]
MIFDPIRAINMFLNRETIEEVLFESELMVATSKIDVSMVINAYASKLASVKPFASEELRNITKRLKGNQNKYNVYADYVDPAIISLLRIADQKGLSASTVLKEYAPIRKISMRNYNRIKSALTMPMIIFIAITMILSSIASKLGEARSAIDFSFFTLFILDHFVVINMILFVLLITAFFVFPRKVPILSKIYQKLDSLLAVSLAQTMYTSGLSSKDIIPMLRRQFGIMEEKGRGDIAELVKLLSDCKFLTPNEMADLELAMDYGQFDPMLNEKKEKKIEEARQFSELIGEIVKNFSTVVVAIPILQFVIIVMDLVMKSTSLVSQ